MSRKLIKLVGVLAALTLVGTACGGDGDGGADGGRQGGSIVVAAEQFPDCLNVIDPCSNASWLHWAVTQNVLPKAMTLDPENNFVASPLLVEAPTLENGGLKENPFTITYKIDPDAKWDDGTPITWEDFHFTWRAVMETEGSLSTLGYDKISKIEQGANEREAVITFTEIYSAWQDLFGGSSVNGYVLKKSAFPKGPNLAGQMQSEIPFSGGPWKLQRFTKDQELILVKNAGYWDEETTPILDQVTIVAREDQSTEIQALKTGEVVAIYPQPSGGNLAEDLKAGNVGFASGGGTTYEGLWINMDRAPMNDVKVRQAFAYAIDRQAIVDRIVKPNDPNAKVLNCAGWVPTVSDWCDETDFAKYTYKPEEAKNLLQQAGWSCSSNPCTKGGQRLTVTIHTTAGNQGRADTLAIAQEKAKAAGFDLQIRTLASPSPIFTDFLPKRQHMVALFANVASPDPSVTSFLSADQIPNAQGGGGQNWSGWRNQRATQLLKQADQTLEHDARRDLLREVGDLEAEEIPWLPLYQKPLITAWRSDRIGGPIDDYNNSPLSSFYNMYDWYLLA